MRVSKSEAVQENSIYKGVGIGGEEGEQGIGEVVLCGEIWE